MLHPEIFDNHGFYYPIGNSPAINLVGYLPPEIDAEVLLLGCGDVRNILFTLFTEPSDGIGNGAQRKYHFTCCDFEGAVIARNILLLAMILKNEETTTMWPIYYDFFMSEKCSQALKRHLGELLSASEDVDSWLKSNIGKVLTVGSKSTLAVVRHFWGAWMKDLNDKGREGQRRKSVERELSNIVKEHHHNRSVISLARSAGPLTLEIVQASIEHFNHYWKHGTTDRQSQRPPVPNPTFCLSKFGKKLSVHYGTNPLSGFHLSTAVVPFGPSDFQPMHGSSDFTPLVKCAKQEFELWCQAFRKARDDNTVTICFFVDDALGLCGNLSPVTDPTGIKEINETNSISKGYLYNHPNQFNVIDVSNLIDHLGTYNILLSVLPLLRKNHTSYLNTETLLHHEFDLDHGTEALYNVFGVDPASLFTLLGITVVDLICGQTSISHISEHQLEAFGKGPQRHSRLVWKWISSFQPGGLSENCALILQRPEFAYDEGTMIAFLAAIYKKLFTIENHTWAMQQLQKSLQKGSLINFIQHNSRTTFSLLLQRIKKVTSKTVDWGSLVEKLTVVIAYECGSLIASCFQQEQDALNHLHGVKTTDYLRDHPAIAAFKYGRQMGLGEHRHSNALTCITISVPIKAFHKLLIRDSKTIGNPQLQINLACGSMANHFCALRRSFGKLDAVDASEPGLFIQQGAPTFKEDFDGWIGTSDILYSCMVPTWFILLNSCEASLSIVSTPVTSLLVDDFGPLMNLFEASVRDRGKVRLSTEFPLNKSFCDSPEALKSARESYQIKDKAFNTTKDDKSNQKPTPNSSGVQSEYKLLMVGRHQRQSPQIPWLQMLGGGSNQHAHNETTRPKISRISYRWSVESDKSLVKLLEDKAPISTTKFGSSTIRIHLGPTSKAVTFPFPICGEIKISVARKSKFIEIDTPLYDGDKTPIYCHFPIGITNKSHRSISPWSIHRINLDNSPSVLIDLTKHDKGSYEWINSVATFSLSKQERANINSSPTKYFGDLMSEIKETIHMILVRYTGIQGSKHSAFVLSCVGIGGYMLIYVKNIRIDLSGQSITADCALLPFEDNTISQIAPMLLNLHNAPLTNSPEESKAWLQLSPSWVERCRTWEHKPNCQYLKTSRVPLSAPDLRIGDSPICSCGKGIFPKEFHDDPVIKPLLRYATRAALGPLFPPPYSKELQNLQELIAAVSGINLSTLTVAEPKERVCAACGKEETEDRKLKKCVACMNIEYCSKECQKKDWKAHKKTHKS
ncbi:hypothetical protein TWF718_004486 [Orbilia javanica]|uniref:MYND-type domain-containing protein n=1 Tax=Orbilia javanica TaxID=47235 RepID=A0AAN8N2R9_9PEZI